MRSATVARVLALWLSLGLLTASVAAISFLVLVGIATAPGPITPSRLLDVTVMALVVSMLLFAWTPVLRRWYR
jgi:hypothetical protein